MTEIMKEFEQQIKLHINANLYEKGYITKEIYEKSKDKILSGC